MDSRIGTYKHIQLVQRYLNNIIVQLLARSAEHDQSKLYSPEVEAYDKITPKLADSTYMSEEYKGFLEELGPALEHHYKNNRHHPEFNDILPANEESKQLEKDIKDLTEAHEHGEFPYNIDQGLYERIIKLLQKSLKEKQSRINSMNLIDLVEMIVDWKCSSLRSGKDNIYKSIEVNQERFGYSNQLKNIFNNTVHEIENGKL